MGSSSVLCSQIAKFECLRALTAAGFTARSLRTEKFSFEELKAVGFTARDLHQAGFDFALLVESFGLRALTKQGFEPKQLRTGLMQNGAGFQIKLLQNAGFGAKK